MIKERNVPKGFDNLIKEIAARSDVSERFAKILVARGIKSVEEADKFLNPRLEDLRDPFDLEDMSAVVERLKAAKENQETVVVYGDYDADGISAVTVLHKGLKLFGIDSKVVVPERENGYGLTDGVLETVLEEYCPDLIVTVDCGVSSREEIENLKDLGVDVIVTDHHEPPENLPDCPTINCKKGGYPFDGLCGAGVAYKLVYALIGKEANRFLDVVALATIADSMPLRDENRIIVSEGLKLIKSGRCLKAIRALVEASGIKDITASAVAYGIAPRVNASGRMGDAYSALAAFISEDNYEIKILVDKLNSYNSARQAECEKVYAEAKKKLESKSVSNRIIVLSDKGWKSGLIGIVAARLAEEYARPVILFSERNGILRGSARSFANINVLKAIAAASGEALEYGGHSQAAGVSVDPERLDAFEEKANEYLVENYRASSFKKETEIDGYAVEKFTLAFARELRLLEPCGADNPKPLFAVEFNDARATPLKFGSPSVSFSTPYIDLTYFNGYENIKLLNSSNEKIAVFEPNISEYNGKNFLRGYVRNIFSVVNESDGLNLSLFENQLRADEESNDYEKIDCSKATEMVELARKEAYGTLFVVNDAKNACLFGDKLDDFEKYVLKKTDKGNLNAVCYGFIPSEIGDYERVVFLDKPLYMPIIGIKTYVNVELDGFDAKSLSVEREDLGRIYVKLKTLTGGFISAFDVREKTGIESDERQIAFAIKAFEELKLVVNKNGRYFVEGGKKTDLSQSKIYLRVSEKKNVR